MSKEKKKEIVGYEMDDGNIYCVECIKKNYELVNRQIEDAITSEDLAENDYLCDGCKKEIR